MEARARADGLRCSRRSASRRSRCGVPRGRHQRQGQRVRDARCAAAGARTPGRRSTARRTSSISASGFGSTACRSRRTTSCRLDRAPHAARRALARDVLRGDDGDGVRAVRARRGRRRGRRGRARRPPRRDQRAGAARGRRRVDRDRSRRVPGRHARADRVGEGRDLQAGPSGGDRRAGSGDPRPAGAVRRARRARRRFAWSTDECAITDVDFAIGERARRRSAPPRWAGGRRSRCERTESAHGCTLRSPGVHQAANTAMALTMLDAAGPPYRDARWPTRRRRWRTCTCPGGFSGTAPYIFDVAHNPDGAAVLARDRSTRSGPQRRSWRC